MKNIRLVSYSIGLSFILTACSSIDGTEDVENNIGYFVNNFDTNINYHCKNELRRMTDSGKFECDSFPISFYWHGLKIGEISTIHNDGYVYPQDIIILEDNLAIYSSDSTMPYLGIDEEAL